MLVFLRECLQKTRNVLERYLIVLIQCLCLSLCNEKNMRVLPEHVDESRDAPSSEDSIQPLVVV